MIRRPPRSTLDRSSAASDVYKRQLQSFRRRINSWWSYLFKPLAPVSYTHLRAHETGRNLVCRLLLEKKKTTRQNKPKPHFPHPPQSEHPLTHLPQSSA